MRELVWERVSQCVNEGVGVSECGSLGGGKEIVVSQSIESVNYWGICIGE